MYKGVKKKQKVQSEHPQMENMRNSGELFHGWCPPKGHKRTGKDT